MIQHIVYCPFTGLGAYNGYRGDKWLVSRIKVFKRFVLPSLMNQSKKEFILWISWRPEERQNPIVKDFVRFLNKFRGLRTVHTFHGLCFFDDRKENGKAHLIRNLGKTLPELREYVAHADWVYMTIQPSDDMYCSGAFWDIQNVEPEMGKAIHFPSGYIMNYSSKEVAEYNPDTMSPFATTIFPKDVFLDPWKHLDYTGPYESHEYVKDFFRIHEIPKRSYMVGTHGANISTAWSIPYKGREILGTEREYVWLSFSCWDTDPLPMHKSWRLYGRILYNKLPKSIQKTIKSLYHSLRNYVK